MSNARSGCDPAEQIPQDVTDVLLWCTAARVIAAHQPQPGRPARCVSLLCAEQQYPCSPVRAAHRAQQLSRTGTPVVTEASETSAIGRAAVVTSDRPADAQPARHRFAEWFGAVRTAIVSRGAPTTWQLPTAPATWLGWGT